LIGGGCSKFKPFFRLSAAQRLRLFFIGGGGGGSEVLIFFRLSAAAFISYRRRRLESLKMKNSFQRKKKYLFISI
jgi:hypothetical protein